MGRVLVRAALAGAFVFALIESAQVTREADLTVRILDSAGHPVPARVRLEDSAGARPKVRGAVTVSESAIPIPRAAIAVMWGQNDRAEGYALQPDGSFYVDGGFGVRLPPGTYRLTLSKGFEYTAQTASIDLAPGANVTREFRLARWVDMPARGWYSADDHIHLRRSPGDDPKIARWIAAEDLHVGNLLQMGDFFATYFSQYAFGDRGRYQEGGRILSPGQEEPRTPEIGHTISLGAREFVRSTRDYYSFDRIFDRVRALGGVTGFAHQGMSFHGYRGMVLNTLRGKTDFLELVQFCVPEGPLATEHYYRFLDMGYRLTALAGSDFPWCGVGPSYGGSEPQFAQIGNARFYVYTGGALTFENYMAGLKAGHTFVTTGPMLNLTVNGKLPGDSLDVAPGTRLHISAEAMGSVNSISIVAHGKVIAQAAGNRVETDITPAHGLWIAARCDGGRLRVAHTTPVYVTVNHDGFENPETLRRNVETSEGFLKELEAEMANPPNNLDEQAPRHRAELERQIAEARAVLRGLMK
ncbi:MAG: carboxypeptidase regulatory-like domain-containing protein [Acidobacteria bacterium]|nr:carboxypeptidase regulatory-like domain-containing protein [Acidobacteriota bacterium]